MSNEQDQRIQREVNRLMRQIDGFVADRERKFRTDTLVRGVDPDDIDAALEMFEPELKAWRRDTEVELTAILRAQVG